MTGFEEIKDRESFLRFVEGLRDDRAEAVAMERESPSSPFGPEANGWENRTIEDFLESAAAWARSPGIEARAAEAESNPWRFCAELLWAGKIYE